MIEVVNDIPLPPERQSLKAVFYDTLRAMPIGASFLIPASVKATLARTYLARFNDPIDAGNPLVFKTFTIRKVTDGFRCWRVE
jgi:hypothetical protein